MPNLKDQLRVYTRIRKLGIFLRGTSEETCSLSAKHKATCANIRSLFTGDLCKRKQSAEPSLAN